MSLFGKVTVIGIGLIGSSLARVIKRDGLARRISCYDVKPQYMQSLPTSDQSKNMSFGKLKPICRPIQKFRSFPGTRWQEPKNQAPKPALTHCLKGAGSL